MATPCRRRLAVFWDILYSDIGIVVCISYAKIAKLEISSIWLLMMTLISILLSYIVISKLLLYLTLIIRILNF